MVDQSSFLVGYFIGRRNGQKRGPDKPFVRTRLKMPSTLWRTAAVTCFLLGAVVSWLLFADSSAVALRVGAGGLIGFAAGIWIVETIWERRETRRQADASTPIGRRR